MTKQAILKALRKEDAANAIVFIHGFGGDPSETWGRFPEFLQGDEVLDDWDVFSLGYTTRLAPDFRGLWSGDPSIRTVSNYFYTHFFAGDLRRYKAFVFLAHSMGGLVVQRALLDREDLLRRTSHVFLFGTPSSGLKKAGWFKWFKHQVEDMAESGRFIAGLRTDWDKTWPKKPPPHFWAVAGDSDEFVPASTCLGPFDDQQRLVVPGNHLEIVKPPTAAHLSVRVVVEGVKGEAAPGGPWNTARVALQMLEFRKAVETLGAHADELDDAHLVHLAIALEGLGDSEGALEVLKGAGRRGTDARGVLAGRLKRRWIAEGRKADYDRALSIYSSAYEEAAEKRDHAQAFYHGINVCFLLTAGGGIQATLSKTARAVLAHCEQAPDDFWCLGTRGEANLYLARPTKALSAYRRAVESTPKPSPWQLKSMHSQACQLVAVLDRDALMGDLDQIFRQGSSLQE